MKKSKSGDISQQYLEKWKFTDCGNYKVSNFGRLYGVKRGLKTPTPTKDGYLTYGICSNGKNKTTQAHRLVAKYFLSDYSETLQVHHKDFDRKNNHSSNLEMVSLEVNIKKSSLVGRYIKRGESNNNCKYDDIKILTIKTCVGFMSDSSIASSLGLKRKYVNDVKLGKIRG